MILRFDVKGINDLVTFRVGQTRKEHWIVVACNDGYIRVFSIKNLLLHRVIKGLGGVPLCIDIAETNGNVTHAVDKNAHRDLMAVGYSDDSFIVYSILQGFKPLYKGTDHRSFVSQIKFDNFFMKKQMETLKRQQEELQGSGAQNDLKQTLEQKIGDMGTNLKGLDPKDEEVKSDPKMIKTASN